LAKGGSLRLRWNRAPSAATGLLEGLFSSGEDASGLKAAARYAARVLLWAMFCGLTATFLLAVWLDWDTVPYVSLIPLTAVVFSFRLVRMQRVQSAIFLSFVAIVLFVGHSSYNVRGIYNAGISILPVLITIAGLWLQRGLMIAFTGITVATVIAAAAGRWLTGRDRFNPNVAGDLTLIALIFCIAAVCGRLLSRHLEASFERVRRSEARYRRIFENIQDAYFEMSHEGALVELSPEGEKLLAEEGGAWHGRAVSDWCVDRSAFASMLREVVEKGRVANVELRLRRADGETRTVLVSANDQRRGDESGGRIAGSMRDITERRALEEKLAQSRKLDSIGKLAGGIAHDFNNLLTVINGHSDLALRRIASGRDPAGDLEAIRSAGERATELTRQLLAFSRRETYTPRVVDVGSVLERISPVLRTLAGEDIALEISVDPSTPRVLADAGQIEQVLINLLANARDAIHEAVCPQNIKRIRISAGLTTAPPPGLPPGRYLCLSVADTGAGIRPEIREKIFEPFFSTRPAGTGLGLATVYGVVTQNGGSIAVDSAPECGSVFIIHWPATDRPLEPAAPPPGKPAAGVERILLVEDDEMVRRFAGSALASHGFAVVEAANGREALETMARQNGDFSLVVTDVVMPEMDGKQLASHLMDRFGNVRILFVSGYAEDRLSHGGAIDKSVHFLKKPYTAEELAAKVREVLDEAR
jgi:PAS domain S-box-containing protein